MNQIENKARDRISLFCQGVPFWKTSSKSQEIPRGCYFWQLISVLFETLAQIQLVPDVSNVFQPAKETLYLSPYIDTYFQHLAINTYVYVAVYGRSLFTNYHYVPFCVTLLLLLLSSFSSCQMKRLKMTHLLQIVCHFIVNVVCSIDAHTQQFIAFCLSYFFISLLLIFIALVHLSSQSITN